MSPNLLPRELNGAGISKALSALNRHMQLYGYELLELPIIDDADLFLIKAGDQIINHMFTFDRHNKQLALRPEFTASATHHYVQKKLVSVARWQFAGSIFEDRLNGYEQLGIGAELIGLSGTLADSEIIAMSAKGLDAIGIPNWSISIGHMGLIKELLVQFNLDARTQQYLLHNVSALHDQNKGKQWLLDQFDKQNIKSGDSLPTRISYSDQIATMGGRTYDEIMQRVELKKRRIADRENFLAAVELVEKWSQFIGSPETILHLLSQNIPSDNVAALDIINKWREVVALLDAHGIPSSKIVINPSLVRSWEYYTGLVFELYVGELHIGGGGRYDELGRLIGSKQDVPAVGFAYYGDKLLSVLPVSYFEANAVLTVICNDVNMLTCAKWANLIRFYGFAVQIAVSNVEHSKNTNSAIIEDNDTLRYGDETFNFSQIDQLIDRLNTSVFSK